MFDLDAFLEKYAQIVNQDSKGEIYLRECPFCGKSTSHATSFSVSETKKIYHCFRCGASGKLPRLVSKLAGISLSAAMRMIGEDLGLTRHKKEEKPEIVSIQLPPRNMWTKKANEYLKSRNLTEKTIRQFGLYYCGAGKFRERIVIPVLFQGQAATFQARSVYPKHEVRYRSPFGAPKSQLLYNIDCCRSGEEVVIAEGPFDVMKLWQNGIAAVCPLGKSISQDQVILLRDKGVRSIILMQDPDTLAHVKTTWLTLSRMFTVKIAPLFGSKDPAELDRTETQQVIMSQHEDANSVSRQRFSRWRAEHKKS